MTSKASLHLIIGFVLGISLYSFFSFGYSGASFFIIISGAIFLFQRYCLKSEDAKWFSIILATSVIFFGVGLGAFRFQMSVKSSTLDKYENQYALMSGKVINEPDIREKTMHLVVNLKEITLRGEKQPSEEKILVFTDPYLPINYGDIVTFSATLRKPNNFITDGGKQFDYASYLAKDDIFYTANAREIEVIEKDGSFLKTNLYSLKNAFLAKLNGLIPSPHNILLGGLILGAKKALGSAIEENFRKIGIIHIIVLSGFNITLIADGVRKFLQILRVPTMLTAVFSAVSIIFFVIMTGASATIVRAGFMALLVILARILGRTYLITRALLITAFIMLLDNPKILVFDRSFQLSFLATIGLIYLLPIIEKKIKFSNFLGLKTILCTTLATQVAVLPLLLYQTGEISLVSLVSNMLVLPIVAPLMFLGFLGGGLAFIIEFAALPFAYISYFLLEYIFWISEFFSSLPFATLSIPYFPFVFVAFLYVLIFCFARKAEHNLKKEDKKLAEPSLSS